MSLRYVDLDAVMRRLAEKRIEDAMAEGKFANLPGAGRPLQLEPIPADEEARLMWWSLRILRQNDVIPEEVQWRKRIDQLKAALVAAVEEHRLVGLVTDINRLIHQLNTLGTNALRGDIAPVDLEEQRRLLAQRLTGGLGT